MKVPSVVTLVPLALTGPTLFKLTGSPSGSLQPARLARFVIAIFQVDPGITFWVTSFAITGGRSFVTTRYSSLPDTPNERYWPDTTPPPPTVTAGKLAPDTNPPLAAEISL